MYYPIRGIGSGGVNTDLPHYELQPNVFSRVSNARFWDGSAQRHPDPQMVESSGTNWTIEPNAVEFTSWLDREGSTQFAYATQTDLYRWNVNAASWDNANNGTYSSSTDWDSVVFGDTVIFTNGADTPQMLENGSATFADLTAWPANTQCRRMRRFKSFLVGLGVTNGATFSPNKIIWSDTAETDTVPQSWDIGDDTVLAGDNVIGSDDGEIVDGLELGDVFIIYTTRAIYEMSFIGAPFVMAFRKISSNSLINPKAVVEYDNYHFCVGEQELYIHDGQNITHIADQRVREAFFAGLVDKTSVKIEVSPITKEIIVLFGDTNSATQALIWCYRWDTFTFVSMPGVTSIEFGFLPGTVTTWQDLQDSGIRWSELNTNWSQFSSSDLTPTVFLLSSRDNVIYQSDLLFSSSSNETTMLERTGMDVDQIISRPTSTVKLIKQFLPQIIGDGVVSFQLGCADIPGGAVVWQQPQDFDISEDYFVDGDIAGRYLAYRLIAGAGSRFRFTGIDIDIQEDGER